MATNKEIMKNWQLPRNSGYGRISEALDEVRSDERAKIKRLVVLWKKLIALDDKNWTSSNWNKYSKEWNKIKSQAKTEIQKLKKFYL